MPRLRTAQLLAVAFAALTDPAMAVDVPPGGVTEFEVPLSLDQRRQAGGGRQSATDRALCAVAVPADFNPSKQWPVLVVSSTSDPGFNSSVAWLRGRFATPAIESSWVVVAADPPTPQPPVVDTNELRYALATAALETLAAQWPGIRDWPLAFGGFSGGSKRSMFLAAMAAHDGRSIIGVFLGGCNEDVAPSAIRIYSPPRRSFRRVPVFISGGESDEIVTPVEQRRVEVSLRAEGFSNVRRESYAEGHVFHTPHLVEALRWFDEIRGR